MIQKSIFLLLIACMALSGTAQEITSTRFGKGMMNKIAQDSSWSVKFAPRMQFLAIEQSDYDGESYQQPVSNFLVRRARLKFSGFAFTPKLKYKMELGLTNRDIGGASEFTGNAPRYILDAVVKWNFYKNLVLWAGQTKLPGNIERVISSANLQLVDRSLLNKRFNIDRDVGFQLRNHFILGKNVLVREIFSFSQGEGRNITTGNLGGYQYTGRLEVLPFGAFKSKGDYKGGDLKREQRAKLLVAATFDMNKNAVKDRSNQGGYMRNDIGFYQTDIYTLFLDIMFKYRGFSMMGEYANRNAKNAVATNSDGQFTGDVVQVGDAFNLQAGYLFLNNWELSGRYTSIRLDEIITGKDIEEQYTIGVSRYISGHKLKVQSDFSYTTLAGNGKGLMYRLQFDVHF